MTDELQPIIDKHGQIRRCGTLTVPENFVSSFPRFEKTGHIYTDAEITKLITNPFHIPSRVTFDKTWILDQRSHGSCEGHGEANVLARARYRRGLGKLLLSGAYAYSKVNGGRDNGAALEDGLVAIGKYGICPADLVTWDMIYPSQQPATADTEAAKHKGLLAYSLRGSKPADTIQNLKSALAGGFDCVVAVHVGNRFDTLNRGICGVDSGVGNHAVCVDDLVMVNGKLCFDMANSWGLSFGDDGRGYLTEDHLLQTSLNHEFFCVPTTTEAGE